MIMIASEVVTVPVILTVAILAIVLVARKRAAFDRGRPGDHPYGAVDRKSPER